MTNQLAYPFTLTALDGTQVDLRALHGQPILLLFFNIGCAGCTGRALPLTLDLARQYPALQLVAIHSHFSPTPVPIDSLKGVANYFKLPYPVLLDDGDAIFRHYQAEGTPHWVLINADGTIRKSFFGSMSGARQRLSYALIELFDEVME